MWFTFAATNHYNDEYKYSFEIPNDWQVIPKNIIDEMSLTVAEQNNTDKIDYSFWFQKNNKDYFTYPFVLVKEFKMDMPTYDKILKYFNINKVESSIEKYAWNYSNSIENIGVNDFLIDTWKNLLMFTTQSDIRWVGAIKQLNICFFGKKSAVFFYMYTELNQYNKSVEIFNNIVESFKFDEWYQYDKAYAKEHTEPWYFENLLNIALEGVIWVLPFALIWWLILFFRQKKNKELSNK